MLNLQFDEHDSAYGDSSYVKTFMNNLIWVLTFISSQASSLLSMASEVTRNIFENGRRYHSFGQSRKALPDLMH
jgi:hypothetical protein